MPLPNRFTVALWPSGKRCWDLNTLNTAISPQQPGGIAGSVRAIIAQPNRSFVGP